MRDPLPPCTHRPTCPGCPRYGARDIDPNAASRLRDLAAALSAPPPRTVLGPFAAYRHRARLMVRGRVGAPKIGLFQAGSHRIADIPRCPIHHPLINRVAEIVKQGMRKRGIAPYADVPHRGALRAIQVVIERQQQRAQVVLVENAQAPGAAAALAEDLRSALGDALHSLWWNGNPERTNTVLGPHWQALHGEASVRERLGGAEVCFGPGSFGQSNLPLFDALLETLHAWVPPQAKVADLYAGCGAIGLGLLAAGARAVAFNEREPGSLEGLAHGLEGLPGAERAQVLPGPAAEARALIEAASVVVVDPPRKGIDAPVLQALCDAPPDILIVVSCSLDAFETEAHALAEGGRLALRELVAFDLFPHTPHVETLARFERID